VLEGRISSGELRAVLKFYRHSNAEHLNRFTIAAGEIAPGLPLEPTQEME